MRAAIRAARIENLIDRLDDRGAELMHAAVEYRCGRRYDECLDGIRIIAGRCQKLAAYINGLSMAKRRSA